MPDTRETISKPRLSDIAEAAGVSTATVSRVLNAKPGVSEEKRDAVLTAIDMMGYERPASLRHKTEGLVGIVVPELSNPIFPSFVHQLESQLAKRGYTPLLCSQSPGGMTEDDAVELLLSQGVSGIIFVSGLHADLGVPVDRYRSLTQRGIPLAFINGGREGIDGTFVSTDDRSAMDVAVRHLVALGHTRIALLVGPDRFVPSQRKAEAFQAAMQEHLARSAGKAKVFHSWYTVEGGAAAAQQALQDDCTAVVCGSDIMALGAIEAARSLGLKVPRDFSVIGFDDSQLMAFVDPPLTTIHQPVGALGQAAVSALLGEFDGNPGPRTELLFRPELIVRASTGATPHPS